MTRIILASQSQGRKQLLEWIHLPFESIPADIDETELPNESPQDYVKRLAVTKAQTVFDQQNHEVVVIGADTTVYHNHQIIGKPVDLEDARKILRSLRNTYHFVYTGLAVVSGQGVFSMVDTNKVTFAPFSDEDLETYLRYEDPLTKAAGYTVLRHGKLLTKEIDGSISGVIGLPVKALVEHLARLGIRVSPEGIASLTAQVGRFD